MDTCLQQFPTLYKIETRGDAYVVVGGLDIGMDTDDSYSNEMLSDFVMFSFLVQDIVRLVPMDRVLGTMVQLRCGISTGGLVSGVTGKITPKFCIFGDAVNIAIRLEKLATTDFLHVSNSFAEYLDKYSLLSELSSMYTLEKRSSRKDDLDTTEDTYWLKKGSMLDLKTRYSHCYKKVSDIASSSEKYAGYHHEH
jgi:class 3 adenylate cyclase